MPLVEDPTTAQLYGIDLRLTDDGDLAVSNGGDLVQCIGTTNAAQAVVQRLRTAPGSLPLHPDYGSDLLTTLIGGKQHDAQLVLAHVNNTARAMAEQDRRFLGITNIDITTFDQTVAITCAIVLAGGERLRTANLALPRTDELAIDPADLADLLSLADLADLGATDLIAGIDPTDPDYGAPVDFAQLLDTADSLEPVETE